MKLKTIVLATAFTIVGSVAFAQPAPIGSSADFGNGAVINRGPVTTTGEDLDFRTDRSSRHWQHARHAHNRHFAEHRRY